MLKVLYIDDEVGVSHRAAQKIKELLELGGKIECELQPPPESFADLPELLPDALLVDFDLRTAQTATAVSINYYGSTLAAEMRMRHPVCPIILVTRPQVIGNRDTHVRSSLDVDLILFKEEINTSPEQAIERISSLVEGFKLLASIHGKRWEAVASLMEAEESELNDLREAFPPVKGKEWYIPQMSYWIREVILRFPGILYDELNASARLGISAESFRTDTVQNLFAPALYRGVFHTFTNDRWWAKRVLGIAKELMIRNEISGPASEGFINAVETEFNITLSPSICVVDGTAPADWVCYILKQPVKLQNSLPYHPDNRPPVMDQARVSFKAITEEQDFDDTLIDDEYRDIVDELWK